MNNNEVREWFPDVIDIFVSDSLVDELILQIKKDSGLVQKISDINESNGLPRKTRIRDDRALKDNTFVININARRIQLITVANLSSFEGAFLEAYSETVTAYKS